MDSSHGIELDDIIPTPGNFGGIDLRAVDPPRPFTSKGRLQPSPPSPTPTMTISGDK
jgi:hypothetical protein